MSARPPLPAAIVEQRVIAVARRLDPARAADLGAALQAGGLDVVEVTMESGSGPSAISRLRDTGVLVGAGTVTTIDEARAAVDAGATFLVAPHTDLRVVTWAVEHDVVILAGAMTPTEVVAADRAGASAVKIFPASVVGPAFITAVLAPFPDLALVPTGGIGVEDAAGYLDAGAVAIGAGAWLTGPDDLDLVASRAAALRRRCAGTPDRRHRTDPGPLPHLV